MDTQLNSQKLEQSAKNAARSIESNGLAFADNFKSEVKAYSKDAVQSLSKGYDTTVAWAKKNPFQAAAIGAGVGFAIGAVARRLMADRRDH
jgi:ElaB/YqjD/DUF883 family membrane-anchored ribosome-binding protein